MYFPAEMELKSCSVEPPINRNPRDQGYMYVSTCGRCLLTGSWEKKNWCTRGHAMFQNMYFRAFKTTCNFIIHHRVVGCCFFVTHKIITVTL